MSAPGDDLARNAPGASAGARARELRHEHPLLTSAAAVLGIRTSAEQFAAGARGERAVGRQLNRWAARYGWHVLHAVPVGQRGADIDHVVIPRPRRCAVGCASNRSRCSLTRWRRSIRQPASPRTGKAGSQWPGWWSRR
jgi:hypothetical protein